MAPSRSVQPRLSILLFKNMNAEAVAQISKQPLGTSGDLRRRLLLHHLPLALASAVVLVLFMTLSPFDVTAYPHADIFSGTFPQQQGGDQGGGGRTGPIDHSGGHIGPMHHGGHHAGQMGHGGDHGGSSPEGTGHQPFIKQFTVASGYVALGLLALTLLIGPANLLLGRRIPVSNYLARDVGTWAAIFSVVHLLVAWLAHVNGGGLIGGFLHFFVAPDGSLLTNSFGLGNWTGLVALVIVVGLLAISRTQYCGNSKRGPGSGFSA
jgi:hypothetical protein